MLTNGSTGLIVAALALALTLGGMTLFSAVIAPLVFTMLPGDIAARFIRQIFPWYYLTMGATTLVALVCLMAVARDTASWEISLTTLVFMGFVFVRQVLMPEINEARDAELAGDTAAGERFKRLHRASVAINGAQWLAVLAAFVLLLT